jgi:hypothetical protein
MRKNFHVYWENEAIPLLLVIIISSIIFFMICPQIIDPGYTGWLLMGGDNTQHYIGWEFYSHDSWHFPLTVTKDIFYGSGSSIIYTDSLPLLAMPFKIFSGFLPANFQYFGLWYAMSVVLMGILGYRLLRKFNMPRFNAVLSSMFFTMSPTVLFRMGGHDSLAGQWIILLALCAYFSTLSHKKRTLAWAGIFVTAISIHVYFAAMILFIWAADIIKLRFLNRVWSWKRVVSHVVIVSAVVAAYSYIIGMFYADPVSGGYGHYSANLDTFFNPLDTSGFLNALPVGTNGQYEGYGYLGLGMIVILLLVISLSLQERWPRLKALWEKYWPLIIALSLCFLFALSNHIYIGRWTLLSYRPGFLERIFNTFRSGGRFIWPVFYCFYIAVIIALSKKVPEKAVTVILLAALGIQAMDLSPLIKSRHEAFVDKKYTGRLKSAAWAGFISQYKYIEIHDLSWPGGMADVAHWAANHGLKINDFYFARNPRDYYRTLDAQKNDIESGRFKRDTLYINPVTGGIPECYDPKKDFLANVDGMTVYAPLYAKSTANPGAKGVPSGHN